MPRKEGGCGRLLAKKNERLYTEGLMKRYGSRTALSDVSIHLDKGEVVGLLGPNGAGKTTCFYAIAGFVRPTAVA